MKNYGGGGVFESLKAKHYIFVVGGGSVFFFFFIHSCHDEQTKYRFSREVKFLRIHCTISG